ncbi:MAG: FMN-binding protein [Planctomycetota bacterium]|jgi:electron transport complex protein RnfG
MSKIKHFFEQSWLLIIASFCFGLLIAVTNAGWSGRILQNEIDKRNRLMTALIADASSFDVAVEAAEIPAAKGKILKTDIYQAVDRGGRTVGFAFIAVGSGFADKIKLVIAVDAKCEKLLGYKVLASNETPGFGDKIKEDYLGDQFKGAPAGTLELVKAGDDKKIDSEIVAISGATVSSEAVVKTFNTYIDKVKEQLQMKGLTK